MLSLQPNEPILDDINEYLYYILNEIYNELREIYDTYNESQDSPQT